MAHLAAVPFQDAGADRRVGTVATRLEMAFLPIGDATPFEVTLWRTLAQARFLVPVALASRWKFSRCCRPG
ncbi:MAG: hypothetical protein HUJ24_01915 [Rhodobacteraceae bacterium]|nr:hypothetical protein [Paracoccaceae bacterium]